MSRIGLKKIIVPDNVKVVFENGMLKVDGPKGNMLQKVNYGIYFDINEKDILVRRDNNSSDKKLKALHGLYRSLLNNMIIGVSVGYIKKLEINGIGYKVQLKEKLLIFTIGYSHLVEYRLPKGIECKIEGNNNIIILTSYDKQLIGEVAAQIRKIRPPEPYKKKGIKYFEEIIRTKAGKSAKSK